MRKLRDDGERLEELEQSGKIAVRRASGRLTPAVSKDETENFWQRELNKGTQMTDSPTEKSAPVVPVDGDIERLVDALEGSITMLGYGAEAGSIEGRKRKRDAARSSLLKFVSDRMLTPEEAEDAVQEMQWREYVAKLQPMRSRITMKLRLRSNDAR